MVIVAQVGSSHRRNFTSPVLVKDIPPNSLIASRPSNKSNPCNSPSTILTSTVIRSVVPTLSSTTPTPQLLIGLPATVNTGVSFCFHSRKHCLRASDCVQPTSARAIRGIPSNSWPLSCFPDSPGQCVLAAGIDSMCWFFEGWHLHFWKFHVAGDSHTFCDWVHHIHRTWSANQFPSAPVYQFPTVTCFTLSVKFFSTARARANICSRSKSSIWEDARMRYLACSGNPATNVHCRPSSDIPPNRIASLRNSAKKTSIVSPGRKRHAANCFHVVKGSRTNAIYSAFSHN